MSLVQNLGTLLKSKGAALVGVADLTDQPGAIRQEMPRGISLAVALRAHVVKSVSRGPTSEYQGEYIRVNRLLYQLAQVGARYLRDQGYQATGLTATNVGTDTPLPHKTVATKAGLGWIGRSCLLVTPEYGSAVRLNTILTDAPLPAGETVAECQCGDCHRCVEACPGQAPTGEAWSAGLGRERILDVDACRNTIRRLAVERVGLTDLVCGICIESCPWTRRYVESGQNSPLTM